MVRRTINSKIKAKVFKIYDNQCYICGYKIIQALVVHHIIPAELWGKDTYDIKNLVLICANCHKIVHRFSSNKYKNLDIAEFLISELNKESILRVKKIIKQLREFKDKIKSNGNLVQNPYTLKEAAEIVSDKNGFTSNMKDDVLEVLNLIISNIPKENVQKCSYRLLKNGKYISINLMNYLLFRTPGYGDFGEIPTHECLTSFPSEKIPTQYEPISQREPFKFKFAKVTNIGVSYEEMKNLSESEWKLFTEAIQIINQARKTRNWVSNISLSE